MGALSMGPWGHFFAIVLGVAIIPGIVSLTTRQILEEKENAMRSFNVSCEPRDICRIDKSNRMAETPDWRIRNCMCDDDCAIYGDCCPDSKRLNQALAYAAGDRFGCVNLRQYGPNYMVVKCAADWDDETIRSQCERSLNDVSEGKDDPIMTTPVTNTKSRVTFQNVYCAICNHEVEEADLRFWSPRVECPLLSKELSKGQDLKDNLIWNEPESAWGVEIPDGDKKKWYQCYIEPFIPPELEFFVRPCKPWTGTCPKESANVTLKNLCEAYASFVYVDAEAYRNIHCAMCNNATQQDPFISCEDNDLRSRAKTGSEFSPTAFAILFDLNDAGGSGNVGASRNCGMGKRFDPFAKKCRQMFCSGKDMVLRNETCIAKISDVIFNETTSERPFGDYNSSLEFQTCPKFMLSKGDYDLKENKSLYVPVYGKIFEPYEYELVNDSVFICSDWATDVSKFDSALGWVTLVCITISEICLLIHLSFGFVVPEFKNLSGKNLQCLSLSLFIAFGLFLAAQFVESNSAGCVLVAVCMHYFFLCAFWWSSVLAFDLFRTLQLVTTQLRSPTGKAKKFIYYSIWAWVGPLVVVGSSLLIEFADPDFAVPLAFHPHYGKHICWFGQRRALLVYFAAPLAAIMGTNIVLFGWSLYMIKSAALQRPNAVSSDTKKELGLFSRLAILMGLSWIMGLIAGAADVPFLWYIFVILCALQGAYIFAAFTFKSKTVRNYFLSLKNRSAGRFSLVGRKGSNGMDETDNNTHSTSVGSSR